MFAYDDDDIHDVDDVDDQKNHDDVAGYRWLPDDVWYMIMRRAIGFDSHVRSAAFQAADLLTISGVCKGAHRAGVSLAKELSAFVLTCSDVDSVSSGTPPLSYHPIMIRETHCHIQCHVERHTELVMPPRVTGQLKLLLSVLRCQVISEKEARKTYGLSARDLEVISEDRSAYCVELVPLSSSPDLFSSLPSPFHPCSSNVATTTRVYSLAEVQEASYKKFGCLDALNAHIAKRQQCEHRARQLRLMKKRIKSFMEDLMGARVYAAYAEGRLVASQLHDHARRAEADLTAVLQLDTRTDKMTDCANSATTIEMLSNDVTAHMKREREVMEDRFCEFDECVATLHVFCSASALKGDLYSCSCRYASTGRQRDLHHLRMVSKALDAVFADFVEPSCLGVTDWGSIRALLCASSMEGTVAEFARRSLEERHSVRMQLLTQIEQWPCLAADDACSHEAVRDLLRLDTDHYTLNYDNPCFESDCEDALAEVYDILQCVES